MNKEYTNPKCLVYLAQGAWFRTGLFVCWITILALLDKSLKLGLSDAILCWSDVFLIILAQSSGLNIESLSLQQKFLIQLPLHQHYFLHTQRQTAFLHFISS